MRSDSRQAGVTLVELAVAIAVLAIIMTMAVPSFRDFRERQAIKGAAEAIVSTIGLAKAEAIKRDRFVRLQFTQWGEGVCAGATEDLAGGCDCSANKCELASSAEQQRDLKRIVLAKAPNFGGKSHFVIDPKTGTLQDLGAAGTLQIKSEGGYLVEVGVNAVARATVCVPKDAKSLPGVKPCA